MNSRLVGAALGLLALFTSACQDDLPKATLIEDMRILGSQISVVGDETRSTPMPGESVRVSFATVFPEADQTIERGQLMLISCTAPDRYTGGLPICQELIDAFESGAVEEAAALFTAPEQVKCSDIPGGRQTFGGVTVLCLRGEPNVQLTIPEDFKGESALFLGILCERGEAFLDPTTPELFGCEDNDGGSIGLMGTYPVQRRDDQVNHNPDASLLSIEMEPFIEWRPIDAEMLAELPEDCAAATATSGTMPADPLFPGVDVGLHELTLRYPAEARERALNEPGEPFENLEISVHATFGEVERQFTVFTDDSETVSSKRGEVPIDTDPPWLEEEVSWDPEDDVPVTGQLVRFFVTVRDQRGGFNMSTYAACVR
jgi:hypothetical protein